MFLYNDIQQVSKIDNKKFETYKEDVAIKIEPIYFRRKIVDNSKLGSSSVDINILRELQSNRWVFHVRMPKHLYHLPKTKRVLLNDKKIKVEKLEDDGGLTRFQFDKYENGTNIDFSDLKSLEFQFYSHWQRERIWHFAFKILFDIKTEKKNFTYLNVRDKNIGLNFMESINLNVRRSSVSTSNPLRNNTAYINRLNYRLKFNTLKQNEPLHKVFEQEIELSSPNKYFKPDRRYFFEFADTLNIKDSLSTKQYKLYSSFTRINKYKQKIEYYINNPIIWNKEKKEFITANNSDMYGYHLPLVHEGAFKMDFLVKQNLIDDFKYIEYQDSFTKRLFNSRDALIKLHVNNINLTTEQEDLYYDDWKVKNL
ncbi:hypothetical protein OF364_00865 [Mycoplasma enhydrae]|uniref:MHO_1580 family protein n=1 Tax=Mycoplasma enhydrae TaxID=2499220 RepID=UPI00197C51CB|nr:hypothetical protein [Mycoplasma enhydrae]MBN4089505.1 hypothetical protein [Mycoplasma enhydrae]MCV3733650.1 hypothetical protein [Mycoplasma enhydrae]MCV3753369.1 hypothetical protein [Mycoplasma enhydrae]